MEDDDNFSCIFCHREYRLYQRYVDHLRAHQNPCARCGSCKMEFVSDKDFSTNKKIHIGRAHGKECPFCLTSFPSKNALKAHFEAEGHEITLLDDTPPDSYKCEWCHINYGKRQRSKFTAHEILHFNRATRLFFCERCDMDFVCENDFKIHNSKVHTKGHICPYCWDSFSSHRKLETHVQSNFNSTSNVRYRCRPYHSEQCPIRRQKFIPLESNILPLSDVRRFERCNNELTPGSVRRKKVSGIQKPFVFDKNVHCYDDDETVPKKKKKKEKKLSAPCPSPEVSHFNLQPQKKGDASACSSQSVDEVVCLSQPDSPIAFSPLPHFDEFSASLQLNVATLITKLRAASACEQDEEQEKNEEGERIEVDCRALLEPNSPNSPIFDMPPIIASCSDNDEDLDKPVENPYANPAKKCETKRYVILKPENQRLPPVKPGVYCSNKDETAEKFKEMMRMFMEFIPLNIANDICKIIFSLPKEDRETSVFKSIMASSSNVFRNELKNGIEEKFWNMPKFHFYQ